MSTDAQHRLNELLNHEKKPLQSIWQCRRKSRYTYLQTFYPETIENYHKMLTALEGLQVNLLDDKFTEALTSMIDAASWQLHFLWQDYSLNADLHFNDEMLLLIETIDLLHKTINKQEINTTEFLRLTNHLSDLNDKINVPEMNQASERSKRYRYIASRLLDVGSAIAAGVIIAAVILCSIAGALIPITSLLVVTALLAVIALAMPASVLFDKSWKLNNENKPAYQLRLTFFAAKNTAKVCDVTIDVKNTM